MADPFEKSLRKGMEALGRLVESVIGKAKQASVQVGARGGVQPLLSIESQLAAPRIKDIFDAAIQKIMSNALPDLKNATTLEVGEGPIAYGSRMMANHAKKSIGVEIGGGSIGRQGDLSRGFVLRGTLIRLPFADASFNYIFARLATTLQGDVSRAVRELARVLSPGGQGLLVDFHPFGLYAKRGANRARPHDSGIHRFEDYYRLVRQAGLRIVDVREAYIDEGMRQYFRESEISAYRNLKGSPLLVFLFVYKTKSGR